MYIHNKRVASANPKGPVAAGSDRETIGMSTLFARRALLPDGWHENVRLTLGGGVIRKVETKVSAEGADERHDVLLPAMPNLHSHAFQHAMAGLAERRGPGDDSFWSWRTLMYDLALGMTPDEIEIVATRLYMRMLEAGFSRVGEFHYLHHDRDGQAYANPAEHAARIAAASAETGIGLTLLPVFYAHAGFGGTPPGPGQRRFVSTLDGFARLMEASRATLAHLPSTLPPARLGVAPHSLRAVTLDELAALLPLAEGGPIHIHVAEQVKEVEDCLAETGARPVEFLLDRAPVDGRWCLIHATHMTEAETRAMAGRGAVAGLCPLTEANLGDGIFPAPVFLEAGGRFGIGSDSNVQIGIADELRMLEYSQRLGSRARNVIAPPGGSTGRHLFDGALAGGTIALGGPGAGLAEGLPSDLLSLDRSEAPWLDEDRLLDGWFFAGSVRVDCVWTAGRKRVERGRHHGRTGIEARFAATMARLADR